jgi:glyoxylase-like metal-dependent hydrolase (beta-lactamase superfamily II)
MSQYSFIARMPNHPGALHRAAEIVQRHNGNINRINYDRRIDPQTVFFEVGCTPNSYRWIEEELQEIGYLQTGLKTLSYLKFHVYLPHRSGALFEFLNYTTSAGTNIAYIDFDDSGLYPERVTVSLNVEETFIADNLLNQLKSQYPLEIVEYDTTGERLDDTVFYVRFAQKVRHLIENPEEQFLLSFLHDVNHIVQELTNRGENPRQVFASILETGKKLKATSGEAFYADVQRIQVNDDTVLYCFQLPCGGNIFLFDTPEEQVMVDTGYGIYHQDVRTMLQYYGLWSKDKLIRLIITHADADHCGAGGYFDAPALMHCGTLQIIQEANRAYGSRSQDSILEEVYTTMINLFSRFTPPENIELLFGADENERGGFPVLERITIGNLEVEVLESLGGHLFGQLFLFCPSAGLLFSGDSLMNFRSFTEERIRYNSLADFLITSVNVDSDLAHKERNALIKLAVRTEMELAPYGKECVICGGHGAISVLRGGEMEVFGRIERYSHDHVS